MIDIKKVVRIIEKNLEVNPAEYKQSDHSNFIIEIEKIIVENNLKYNEYIEKNKDLNSIIYLLVCNKIFSNLFLKIVSLNPLFIYQLIKEDSFKNIKEENFKENKILPKKLNENNIILSLSLKHKIIEQNEYKNLLDLINIRNNYSISHIFNYVLDKSFLGCFFIIDEKINNYSPKYIPLADNIKSIIDSINNYIYNNNDNHEIIINALLDAKEEFLLDFLIQNIFNFTNKGCSYNENKLFLLSLYLNEKNEKGHKQEIFLKLFNIIEKEYNSSTFSSLMMLCIINFIIEKDMFLDNDILIKYLNIFKEKSYSFYEFKYARKILELEYLWEKLILENKNEFIESFYNWLLYGNSAGITFNIYKLEEYILKYSKTTISIMQKYFMNSNNNGSTNLEFRKSNIQKKIDERFFNEQNN